MKAYRTIRDGIEGERYDGTLAEAGTHAKVLWPRDAVRVELVEVAIDKEGVVALLNGTATPVVERTWALTERGALREVENGE